MICVVLKGETTKFFMFNRKSITVIYSALLISGFIACETEDHGPVQKFDKEFSVIDFDRLEIGSALNVSIEQSNMYSIKARGDRRNIDDLEVFKSGNTLIIKFDENANRIHETYITITMPRLEGVNFSGASTSKIDGFESDEELDLYISGGSVCQLTAGYREINLSLSGASNLLMSGLGDQINAEISGASVLTAFDYPVREADVNVSGASNGKVTVTDELTAIAEGSSSLIYRGNPSVLSTISGGSVVIRE